MGKRVKKKSRAMQKEKRAGVNVLQAMPAQTDNRVENVDGVAEPKLRKRCPHFDLGFDVKALSEKVGSLKPSRCEDCREGMADGRGAKGKGKHGKNKGGGSADSKSALKAIWVCLQCGHYACGGIGLPEIKQSHAVRHARLTSHPLVIQLENSHLRWCFRCRALIPAESIGENGEKQDLLLEVVKLIKAQPSEKSSVDVEDVWFGGGAATGEITTDYTLSSNSERADGYAVRGLTNLGNTCFFNSVLQNLLAMDSLRDYFLHQDASFGPLSAAMKKLFSETRSDTGLRNVINPRFLFGCVCSKASQFRGYQQQDSHELLRYLLDGLATEELAVKKRLDASDKDGDSKMHNCTFVDSAFGGQISSTVSCLECGHSSTVYEPFLDLSLPVPTKKPPAKRVQPVTHAKKIKLPPKKAGKFRPKGYKDTDIDPGISASYSSVNAEDARQKESSEPLRDNAVTSFGDNVLGSVGPASVSNESNFNANDFLNLPQSGNDHCASMMKQTADSFLEFSWMDYIEQGGADENEFSSESYDVSASLPTRDDNTGLWNATVDDNPVCSFNEEFNQKLDSLSVNSWEEEVPQQVVSSEVLLLPYKEENLAKGEVTRVEAEASLPVVDNNAPEEGDFDGLGDLFNEPEVSAEPVSGPLYGYGVAESGFTAVNASDSDLDEVDDSDAPVSVDSCLVHFIKPELLVDDNAWECENCSKTLQRKVMEIEKQLENVSEMSVNGVETQIQSHSLVLNQDASCTVGIRSNGGDNTDDSHYCIVESLESNVGELGFLKEHPLYPEIGGPCLSNRCQNHCIKQTCSVDPEVPEQLPLLGYCRPLSQENSHDPITSNVDAPNCNGHLASKDQEGNHQLSGNFELGENDDQVNSSKQRYVKRDATKKVLIDKAPSILTVHLKRFSHDARGRLSKLNGHVNFRTMLNLEPYMDPRCINGEKYVYHLIGVVEHSGTMRGGHYVAYIRGERSKCKAEKDKGGSAWFHVSDAYVREVSLEEVLRSEAYILFYERI